MAYCSDCHAHETDTGGNLIHRATCRRYSVQQITIREAPPMTTDIDISEKAVEAVCENIMADAWSGAAEDTLRALRSALTEAEMNFDHMRQEYRIVSADKKAAEAEAAKWKKLAQKNDPMARLKNEVEKAAREAEEDERKITGGEKMPCPPSTHTKHTKERKPNEHPRCDQCDAALRGQDNNSVWNLNLSFEIPPGDYPVKLEDLCNVKTAPIEKSPYRFCDLTCLEGWLATPQITR